MAILFQLLQKLLILVLPGLVPEIVKLIKALFNKIFNIETPRS
jgi:hypothetical protein